MDRNIFQCGVVAGRLFVALRKESVDRNHASKYHQILLRVALRKESVDRNVNEKEHTGKAILSLSARRAWIEIISARHLPFYK